MYNYTETNCRPSYCLGVWEGTDKSLARPWRKQATATKLGIYSVHFLSHCSNFREPLKKIQKVVRPTRSLRQQWPPRRKKNGDLSIFFSVHGTGGSPTGSDPENRVGDQDIGSPGRPVSFGLQVPNEAGHCRATPLVTFLRCFPFKMSFSYTSRDE